MLRALIVSLYACNTQGKEIHICMVKVKYGNKCCAIEVFCIGISCNMLSVEQLPDCIVSNSKISLQILVICLFFMQEQSQCEHLMIQPLLCVFSFLNLKMLPRKTFPCLIAKHIVMVMVFPLEHL